VLSIAGLNPYYYSDLLYASLGKILELALAAMFMKTHNTYKHQRVATGKRGYNENI
jgi:hypothetical protein